MASLSDWRESFHFISFVPVWLFQFFSGSFQAAYTKSMYSGPTISYVNRMECWSVVCPKHAFMPCWIAAQYVARVLHFCASSLNHVNYLLSTLLVYYNNIVRQAYTCLGKPRPVCSGYRVLLLYFSSP